MQQRRCEDRLIHYISIHASDLSASTDELSLLSLYSHTNYLIPPPLLCPDTFTYGLHAGQRHSSLLVSCAALSAAVGDGAEYSRYSVMAR